MTVTNYKQLEAEKLEQDALNLGHFEQKFYSQNGEDGIIAEIFRRISSTDCFFVEFGIEDGLENNTRYLLEKQGWSGVWLEGSPEKAAKASQTFADFPVRIFNSFIDRDNINGLFEAAQIPTEFDLLVIDLDGNDYWVWQALANYSPRVVVIEYNASYLPEVEWIMPYNPAHHWDSTNYFGASLKALAELGQQKGYRLVACDSQGVNAFFVRQDLLNKQFSFSEAGPLYHYAVSKYNRRFFGHPSREELAKIQKNLACWCGNQALLPFSPVYWRCPVCETLVTAWMPDQSISQVTDDTQDFYGRQYWFSHQEAGLGFGNIISRARADLPERDLYWLRTLLKYQRPPARTLELGCAHGGFVAMLNWVGFEATGLELSEWVVKFARQTFAIPVLHGPLEEQNLAPASLDIIALMDVLEHLPDPVGTMRLCLDLLAPGGFLLIQTPCYKEGKSYEAMLTESDRFLELLQADEHLYLFSQTSIRRLFEQLNAPYLQFEPAIFAHYDMFMLVGRSPINPVAETEALSQPPSARLVQALLDLQVNFEQSELDRQARLEVIQTLDKALKATEADRQARLQDITQLQAALATSDSNLQTRIVQPQPNETNSQEQLEATQAEANWWKKQAQQLAAMRGVRLERWLHRNLLQKLKFNKQKQNK